MRMKGQRVSLHLGLLSAMRAAWALNRLQSGRSFPWCPTALLTGLQHRLFAGFRWRYAQSLLRPGSFSDQAGQTTVPASSLGSNITTAFLRRCQALAVLPSRR